MYEHAYHIDFGANARAYVDTFMRNIDWKAVQGRHEDAAKVEPPRPLVQEEFGDLPGVDVEEVKAMLDAGKTVQIVDARPRHSMSRQEEIMDGATWRDPDRCRNGLASCRSPTRSWCSAYRLPRRLQDGDYITRLGIRCEVHEGRPLGLESDRRRDETALRFVT
jgi:Fe-Mn family superoxide dismutase